MVTLRAWRKAQGLSAKQAAEMIGVTRIHWHRMEAGSRNVGYDRVLKVEKVTGISRYDLRPDIFGPHPGTDV